MGFFLAEKGKYAKWVRIQYCFRISEDLLNEIRNVRLFMDGLASVSIVSAAIFFFAIIINLNLAIAIHRRAEKSLVVDNLIVILLLIAVESSISLSSGIYGTMGGIDERTRYILANGAYSVQIAAIAVVVYLILCATRRLICDSGKFPEVPAIRGIARSKALHWFLVLVIFGPAVVAAGEQLWRMFSIMGSGQAGGLQMPRRF